MPFTIHRGNIAEFHADVIVSPSNSSLKAGGGASEAIFRAAGMERISAACLAIGHCDVGCSVITPGFDLPAKYVIHTVGPIWNGGTGDEEQLLRSCYRSALLLAEENGCDSIAFPLVSAGIYGCPEDIAFSIASDEISAFLVEHEEMQVTLVRLPGDVSMINARRRALLDAYLKEHFFAESGMAEKKEHPRLAPIAAQMLEQQSRKPEEPPASEKEGLFKLFRKPSSFLPHENRVEEMPKETAAFDADDAAEESEAYLYDAAPLYSVSFSSDSLDELMGGFDDPHHETFYDAIVRMVNKKQITMKELRRRSLVNSKVLSKIKSGGNPSRATALALAAGLRLNPDEAVDFLACAGIALSPYRKADVIVKHCLEHQIFNVMDINILLDEHGEAALAVG